VSDTNTVLGALAATGWFAKHGEVALTTGLAHVLQKDRSTAAALLNLLVARSGVAVPDDLLWLPEGVQDDRGRVDVVGSHVDKEVALPVVFIEAKIHADLGDAQVRRYVTTQQRQLAGTAFGGVVVVLVPESRMSVMSGELTRDLAPVGARRTDSVWEVPGATKVKVILLAWDEAIDVMKRAASDSADDLNQLLGAARAMRGSDIAALTDGELSGSWRTRRADISDMVDRVTNQATRALGFKLAPWQGKSSDGLEGGFRYIGLEGLPNLAVGVRPDVESPPLWVRWHRNTKSFNMVADRLGKDALEQAGHLWVALEVTADSGSATRQIRSMATQVERLFRVAANLPDVDVRG
jgi:hypothetical protein